MATRYRVIVEQIDDVDGADYETRETIMFEAISPSLPRLLVFAPDEVRAALLEALGEDELAAYPQRVMSGVDRMPAEPVELRATVFNGAGEVIPAAPQAAAEAEQVAEAPAKRKRRTKAEIAADKAREAAEAADVPAGPVVVEPGEATSIVDPFARTEATVAAAEALQQHADTAAADAGYAPQAPVAAPEPAAAAPAAPYNPFV